MNFHSQFLEVLLYYLRINKIRTSKSYTYLEKEGGGT